MSVISVTGKIRDVKPLTYKLGDQEIQGLQFTVMRRTGRKHTSGERKGQAIFEFYPVKVFNPNVAKILFTYIKDGDYLSVTGEPVLSTYQSRRYVGIADKKYAVNIPMPHFEIHLQAFDFCADTQNFTKPRNVLDAEEVMDSASDSPVLTLEDSPEDVSLPF